MQKPRALTVRSGHQVERNQISGNARVQFGDQYNVTYQTQGVSSIQEQFLDSLWFDTIDERRDNIKVPAPDTLAWIYDDDLAQSRRRMEKRLDWDSFTEWLSIPRTGYAAKLDREWSPDRTLHVLSFFFWRPGNELQKSVVGMLRSLLYQICEYEPSLIDRLIANRDKRKLNSTFWTEKSLKDLVLKAIACSLDSYCIFIDGLDEYVGPFDVLLDLISDVQEFKTVKCCVASRPEIELVAGLYTCRHLRLEDLNYTDIFKYTKRKLSSLVDAPALCDVSELKVDLFRHDLVSRANGVFLWAVLAIPPILKGANSGDDLETLRQRLKSLPSEMSEIYAHMIKKIDSLYHQSLSFYLHSMRLRSEYKDEAYDWPSLFPRIVDVVAAQLADKTCTSYAAFERLCVLESVKIVSQSAGLLEVTTASSDIMHKKDQDLTHMAKFWIPDLVEEHPDSGQLFIDPMKAVKARRRIIGNSVHSIESHYERLSISWVHRSAHDFVFPEDCSQSPLHYMLSDYPTACQKLWKGALQFLAFGPSLGSDLGWWGGSTALRVHRLTVSLCIGMQTDRDGAMRILDSLRNLTAELARGEAYTVGLSALGYNPASGSALVWDFMVQRDFWGVLASSMSRLESEPAGNALLISLVASILRHVQDSSLSSDTSTLDLPTVISVVLSLLAKIHSNAKEMVELFPEAVTDIWICWCSDIEFGDIPIEDETNPRDFNVTSIAWSSASQSESQADTQLSLVEATIRWDRLVQVSVEGSALTTKDRLLSQISQTIKVHPAVGEVTKMFTEIMDKTGAYFELDVFNPYSYAMLDYRTQWYHRRVLIHVSHRLACSLRKYDMGLPQSTRTQLLGDLRIVCFPIEVTTKDRDFSMRANNQTRDFISFTPCRDISDQLLWSFRKLKRVQLDADAFNVSPRDPMLLRRWTNLLLSDVAMNQPQMSAVQRTLALACLRTNFWTFWLH